MKCNITLETMKGYDTILDLCNEIIISLGENKFSEDTNWDDILNLLRDYAAEFGGYNIFPEKIKNYIDFLNLKEDIVKAYEGEMPLIRRTCRDCGSDFYIYKSEYDFYLSKDLELPKRCKGCRNKRRVNSMAS